MELIERVENLVQWNRNYQIFHNGIEVKINLCHYYDFLFLLKLFEHNYSDLCGKDNLPEVSTKLRIVPYLLKLKWRGYVVVHLQEPLVSFQNFRRDSSKLIGWCYIVPSG